MTPLFNLIELGKSHSIIFVSREQYWKNVQNDPIKGSKSSKFNVKITRKTP